MSDIRLDRYEYDANGDNLLCTATSGKVSIYELPTPLIPKIYFRIRPNQQYTGSCSLIWLLAKTGESGDDIWLQLSYYSSWSLKLFYGVTSFLNITPVLQLGVNYSARFSWGSSGGNTQLTLEIVNEDTGTTVSENTVTIENYPASGYRGIWLQSSKPFIVDYAGKSLLNRYNSATTLSSLFVKKGFGSTNAI